MKFTKRKVFALGGKYSKEFKDIRNNTTVQINDKIYTRDQLRRQIKFAIVWLLGTIVLLFLIDFINEFLISIGFSPISRILWLGFIGLSFILSLILLFFSSNAQDLLRYQAMWLSGKKNVHIYENQGEKSFQEENPEEKLLKEK